MQFVQPYDVIFKVYVTHEKNGYVGQIGRQKVFTMGCTQLKHHCLYTPYRTFKIGFTCCIVSF